jgi:hypothetical protein
MGLEHRHDKEREHEKGENENQIVIVSRRGQNHDDHGTQKEKAAATRHNVNSVLADHAAA